MNVLLFQRFESPYDALNRLSTSKDAELNLVTTTYDAHDRVLTVKDGKSNTTTYVYDVSVR